MFLVFSRNFKCGSNNFLSQYDLALSHLKLLLGCDSFVGGKIDTIGEIRSAFHMEMQHCMLGYVLIFLK